MTGPSRPLVVAHVSDLHVSTFGDTFHDARRLVRRSARLAEPEGPAWDVAWHEAGWKVLRATTARKKIRLVDPEGYEHPLPKASESPTLVDPVERAAAKACRLEARRARTLAASAPSAGARATLLESTPKNTNVRLLRAVEELGDVDAVFLTGDLTDDGDGYELVRAAFARFAARGRLFAVPGNHDLYLFPLAGSARPRPTADGKREAWRAFARSVGLELHASGAWARELPESGAYVLGLDSCARPQRRFFRHNGAVGPAQLAYLEELAATPAWRAARHRLVLLHHHVVPLPHGVGRRAPSEIGMRLDDARTVAEAFDRAGVTAVFHGHRHVSEARTPAGANFQILAAPSLTLGCRSGDAPSFWRVELGAHLVTRRVRVPLDAVPDDPATPDAPASEPALDDPGDG